MTRFNGFIKLYQNIIELELQETEAACKRARGANAEIKSHMDSFENFEEEVFNAQKKVAQLEEELDQAATNIKLSTERAEENDKVIVDWELQITALNRRISLLVNYFISDAAYDMQHIKTCLNIVLYRIFRKTRCRGLKKRQE